MDSSVYDSYLVEVPPSGKELSYLWKTAIGLQQTDNLYTSSYLIDIANDSIEGKITLSEAEQLIEEYYETIDKQDNRTEEADKVSVKITRALASNGFNLSPNTLLEIHRQLFTGIYSHAGTFRKENITKIQWVLDGDTVTYSDYRTAMGSIEYDIEKEKNFSYNDLTESEFINHFSKFVSDLWQIHPFREGNTRTIAVFTIKYLKTFGYDINNDAFEKHSQYFRNALVRANYTNRTKGINSNSEYISNFFKNLLCGEKHKLKNRELHIYWGTDSYLPNETDNA
jgi:fido (protein-threonine AMPylation protein)